MRRYIKPASARYGVDIRAVHAHAEAFDLSQVLTALAGRTIGRVQVTDRNSGSVAFAGTITEVREAVKAAADREHT